MTPAAKLVTNGSSSAGSSTSCASSAAPSAQLSPTRPRFLRSCPGRAACPSAMLALMCPARHVDEATRQLVLCNEYGALEVIAGQHRLLAYANRDVPGDLRDQSTVLVIAVRFLEGDDEQAQAWAAQMFS